MNFYRAKQVELLKSNFKNIINKNKQIKDLSEEISFPISSLNMIVLDITNKEYDIYGDDPLDSIKFGRSYLRLF